MDPSGNDGLQIFHPLVRSWFLERIGTPTDIQSKAWPRIARDEHILLTAPTGSGKTLTAFLWALNSLISGRWESGRTRVLYVSPLKALNNDIRRNLIRPLNELRSAFQRAGQPFPDLHVLTRSGDTSQADRRRMVRHPPEILITTPESLNLLLSSHGGRGILTSLNTVILDEIHAVVGSMRGTFLISAVERLVPLSGEFQRIALSATVRPLDTVAEFVGGYMLSGPADSPEFEPRRVTLLTSDLRKQYDIRVRFPEPANPPESGESYWNPLAEELRSIVKKNESTLLFVNNRRLAERLAMKINLGESHPIAYAHHGSLSREIRLDVERKLKAGNLKAIVATHSLELGIDIGHLDEVLLIQSPGSISSAVQRVGRAGHRVGEISRAILYPTHAMDFLESAVLSKAILGQDIESVRPIVHPLDVLAQIIVSMCGTETWDIDALYARIRTSRPYRHLSRKHFDLVLDMLAGKYAETRIRELYPRISVDRLDNTVAARKGALLSLYMSGGVIPDRGYYQLRHDVSGSRIGELDEEFVWEARIGQTFSLGAQNWKIRRITHNDVFVVPGTPRAAAAPFWKAEKNHRDFHYAERIGAFLERADARLSRDDFAGELQAEYAMEPRAAQHLIEYLRMQREATKTDLPHRHHLVVEHAASGPGGTPGSQLVLHTFWGGRVNAPLGLALEAAWEQARGSKPEIYIADNAIIVQTPSSGFTDVLSLVSATNIESLLRKRLEGSGFFGARFREAAGRALLLPRKKMSERMPLWMTRLRSHKLLKAVSGFEDFPILLEAWRTCLQDEFDLAALHEVLGELASGAVRISRCRTDTPSPFARTVSWRQVNEYMYRYDAPGKTTPARLREDLLDEIVSTPGLRPTVPRPIVDRFLEKRRRLFSGYAPSNSRELVDWVKERVAIPEEEWKLLTQAIARDHPEEADALLREASSRLVLLSPAHAASALILALEDAPRIRRAFYPGEPDLPGCTLSGKDIPLPYGGSGRDAEAALPRLLGDWLRFYGPVAATFIGDRLGLDTARLRLALEDLREAEAVIVGRLVADGPEDDLCDRENFEILLRLSRKDAVPDFEPLPIESLPLFLAGLHGMTRRSGDLEEFGRAMERLMCYPAPAEAWESEILPARLRPYRQSWMDAAIGEGGLRWVGSDRGAIAFAFEPDLDLFPRRESNVGDASLDPLFFDPRARYDFSSLLQASRTTASALSDLLWKHVWEGRVTNDSFRAVRRGIATRFRMPDAPPRRRPSAVPDRRSGQRARFARRKGSLPYAGNWFRLPGIPLPEDPMEMEEWHKDRARIVLDRYGILFREMLMREPHGFRWSDLFRSLRLMEFSGEILSGYFFEGIPGPQFVSLPAFRLLREKLPEDAVFWINAADPVSCCGLPFESLKHRLPTRIPSAHIVYRGARPVLVSRQNGKHLDIFVPETDPYLPEYLSVFHHLLHRESRPLRRIPVETINGEPAAKSRYAGPLKARFETVIDHRSVSLYRKDDA